MRAICLYIARTCASKASHWSGPTPFLDAARYSGGIPSTISMAAVPRTSKTWGGKAFVSTVNATFGFAFSADTLGASGTVHRTNSAPFQWKPIGIARGNPSGPTYANRAGILDCISSCASGSPSTRVTSCGCILASSGLSLLNVSTCLVVPTKARRGGRPQEGGSVPSGECQAHALHSFCETPTRTARPRCSRAFLVAVVVGLVGAGLLHPDVARLG